MKASVFYFLKGCNEINCVLFGWSCDLSMIMTITFNKIYRYYTFHFNIHFYRYLFCVRTYNLYFYYFYLLYLIDISANIIVVVLLLNILFNF